MDVTSPYSAACKNELHPKPYLNPPIGLLAVPSASYRSPYRMFFGDFSFLDAFPNQLLMMIPSIVTMI